MILLLIHNDLTEFVTWDSKTIVESEGYKKYNFFKALYFP